MDGISIDARGKLTQTKEGLNHYIIIEFIKPLCLFKIFSPTTFDEKHFLPGSNEELIHKG